MRISFHRPCPKPCLLPPVPQTAPPPPCPNLAHSDPPTTTHPIYPPTRHPTDKEGPRGGPCHDTLDANCSDFGSPDLARFDRGVSSGRIFTGLTTSPHQIGPIWRSKSRQFDISSSSYISIQTAGCCAHLGPTGNVKQSAVCVEDGLGPIWDPPGMSIYCAAYIAACQHIYRGLDCTP